MLQMVVLLILALYGGRVSQDPPQPRIVVAELELRIHQLVNAERAAMKLPPLKIDVRLADIARRHSADMARRDFFDHINPDGKNPTQRGRDARYNCRKYVADYITEGLAENIFQNNLYNRVLVKGTELTFDWNTAEEIALSTVDGWMTSPGHRRTIITESYDRTGVGITIASNDKVFITQLFC
jgi:uncharacterized protein YkwD